LTRGGQHRQSQGDGRHLKARQHFPEGLHNRSPSASAFD
jgi:hypothetical protein